MSSADEKPLDLELSEVSRMFNGPSEVTALQPTTITVESGSYLSVVGASGSGKSTLLSILGCMDLPTSGVFRFGDADASQLSETGRTQLRRNRIGFVFQAYHLVRYLTAAENVLLSLKYQRLSRRKRQERVENALEQVQLMNRSGFLPGQLSGGEQQRVAVARAIVGRPSLLLCDEPTGNLDSESGDRVMSILENQNMLGTTLVVVTHDQEVARRAPATLSISDGHVSS